MGFVLVDVRHEPQPIDLEFMQWLGENQLPFGIIFTKSDKLKPKALQRHVEAYQDELLQTWEELPPTFITSSSNTEGRDELLTYIEQVNEQYNATREGNF